jgi:NADH-quinone oxidoreductase subunit I
MNGLGIIKGMIETARNFAGSYHDPQRLTTVQYPEEKLPPVENARTIPFLVYDGDDAMAGLRCTACTICEKECPPQCIYIIKDQVKKPDYMGKMQLQPKVFDIDISVCMSCGICVEVCPFDAIKMDQVFELSTGDRFGKLLWDKHQLAKPNDYFAKVHKTEASEIDVRREENKRKAEAAAAKAAAPKPPATPGGAP